MLRDAAVGIIAEDLGFVGSSRNAIIIARMQEAQRMLESGTTLPRFLLEEDAPLSLVAGVNTVALPAGFLRPAGNEDQPLRYTPIGTTTPTFIKFARSLSEALEAHSGENNAGPQIAVIRKTVVYFLPTPDINYTLTWSYYKAATVLTTNTENAWLADTHGGAEWLIGETGVLVCNTTGNPRKQNFQERALRGRAALFGDIILNEMGADPLVIGGDN